MPLLPYEKEVFEKAKRKFFKPTIEALNKIALGGSGAITLSYKPLKSDLETGSFAIEMLNSRNKGLPFRITLEKYLETGGVLYKESYGLANPLSIIVNGTAYYTNSESVVNFKTEFPKKPQVLEGTLIHFKSFETAPPEMFARLVVHTDDTDMMFPTDILEYKDNYMKFDYESMDRQSSSIGLPMISTKGMFSRLTIHDVDFDFYGVEQMNSIIIDSCSPIEYTNFNKAAYAIRLAFAFLSGKFYRDETTLLLSNNENFNSIDQFEYVLEPQSKLTDNRLINPTFFFQTFPSRPTHEQEQLKEFHDLFPAAVFSKLCEAVLDSAEIKRTLELLINAGDIADPIQKGALYSVAVETITEYLKDKNVAAFKPVQDSAVWKEFLAAQQELVNSFEGKIDEQGLRILRNKINSLNTPTNRDKLVKPFELYGITLSDDDIQVLEQRNSYLHGGSPSDSAWVAEQNMAALKLHNLVGKLILKYCGYRGHYINLAAWHIMHLRETNERIATMDLGKIQDIKNRLEAEKIKPEEIAEALEYFNNYRKYLTSILEIQSLVQILD